MLLKNGIDNTINQPVEILTFPLTIWQTAAFSETLHIHPLGSPSCQGNTHELHSYVTTKTITLNDPIFSGLVYTVSLIPQLKTLFKFKTIQLDIRQGFK